MAETFVLGDFKLLSGELLKAGFIVYETKGTLNADKSNAILYATWFAGRSSDIVGAAIGEEKVLDPSKYFIIVPNQFGNGLSSSPSNTKDASQKGNQFPAINVYDNVEAQHRLCTEKFGIKKFALVIGHSMSAQSALHWGALYPDMVPAIAAITGSSKTAVHNKVFLEACRLAMEADPAYSMGNYSVAPEKGFMAMGAIFCSGMMSQAFYREGKHLELSKALGASEASADAWIGIIGGMLSSFDANDIMAMNRTWHNADIGSHPRFGGSQQKALGSITANTVYLPAETDMVFPPADNRIEAEMMKNASVHVIPGILGHLAGHPGLGAVELSTFIEPKIVKLLAGS